MTKLTFSTTRSLNEGRVVEFIQQAKDALGLEKLTLTPVTDNPDISFGAGGRVELPLPSDVTYEHVYTALQSLTQRPIPLNGKVLFVDVETHGVEKLWKIPKREFFRLGQYGWGMHSPVTLTTDYDEIMDAVRDADVVVAHNGWSFDFHVLDLYDRHKGFDTMVFANLAFPAPEKFLTTEGKWKVTSGSPTAVKSWLSLDNLAHQLGFDGKLGDLKEMARKHNPPKTPTAELDFGLIPLDDPEFLHYAEQDIHALRDVAYGLFQKRTPGVYDFREQEAARIGALMTRNGFMLDIPAATKRRDELLERKNVLLEKLNREYGLPTEGKMPWRTTAGKKAILDILADSGITEESRPHWERTATGNLSLGGEALTALDPDSELVQSLAELMGQRPLAQQALDYVGADGRTHSDVTMVQRSGRSSITKPGLTTWSNRKDKTDKSYFLASPGHVLISADYSNADQRAVAAMSQDKAYFERFVPGADGHEISGRLMFGDEVYDSDPHKYREIAKSISHAYAYGAGVNTLARTSKLPKHYAQMFVDAMERAYPKVISWQNSVRSFAVRHGFVRNMWGRVMQVEAERSYTTSVALQGQSTTREVMIDGLIALVEAEPEFENWLVLWVHDEIICDVPIDKSDHARVMLETHMPQHIHGIDFTISVGNPSPNWAMCDH